MQRYTTTWGCIIFISIIFSTIKHIPKEYRLEALEFAYKAVDASVAESKTPLPKSGRHVPSLDMPYGLLGISGIPLARNRERVGVRANQIHPQESLYRLIIWHCFHNVRVCRLHPSN